MANNVQVKTTTQVAEKRPAFSNFMATTGNKLIANVLQDPKRKQQFVANLVSAVSSNKDLQKCDQVSVVSAALQAESLHFPINNSLGYIYLVPFKKTEYNPQTRKREEVGFTAQFQIGYKGYIQLAIRSGQYKDISVIEVKEGELGSYDPLNGQKFNWVQDYNKRKELKTIGYVGQIELVNGFKKQLYIPFDEMLDHADTYSQAFDKDSYLQVLNGTYKGDMWKLSSFWYKNFDEMAKKTVLRRLLSKWGIMSVEMTEAYVKDSAELKADGTYDYIDAKAEVNKVEEKKEQEMASIRVDSNGVVQEEPKAQEPEPQVEQEPEVDPFDFTI